MATRTFQLTVLSPVHVGDGTVLSPLAEIVKEGNSTYILDVEGAIRAFPEFFKRFQDQAPKPEEVLSFLRSHRAEAFYRRLPFEVKARDIRVQLRDGRGLLLIPGSTIKGAIRTSILAEVVEAGREIVTSAAISFDANKPKFAAAQIERRLRGQKNEPHYDWLRVLSVTDGAFSPEALGVVQVRIRSPREQDPRREKEVYLACEAILPENKSIVRIGLDDFLLQEGWRNEWGLPSDLPFSYEWLAQVCRKRVLHNLDTEIHYFSVRSPHEEIVRWLKSLRERVLEAPPDTIFLRLGFGIGWCGTTGEIADPETRLTILRRCEMANRPISKIPASSYDAKKNIFPKSRRYIEHFMKAPLFGFVRLDPVPQPFDPISPPKVSVGQVVAPEVERPRPSVLEQTKGVYTIERRLSTIKPQEVKGRFDGLYREVMAIEDPKEREVGLRRLGELVRRHVPKKDKDFFQREDVRRCLEALEGDPSKG